MVEKDDTGQTQQGEVDDCTLLNGLACCNLLSPYYSDDYVTIYHGDCGKIMPHLPKFDLLLTDPPYGLGEKWQGGKASTKARWKLNDGGDAIDWDDDVPDMREILPIANKAIIWGGHLMGLEVSRGWLVWNKIIRNFSSGVCELAWTNLDCPIDAFDFSHGQLVHEGKQHPAQKPLTLMQWCIQKAGEIETIIDPFGGSGTTGLAGKNLGKKSVLIERDEKYCEIAAQRMLQEVLPFNEPTKAHHEVQEELFQR